MACLPSLVSEGAPLLSFSQTISNRTSLFCLLPDGPLSVSGWAESWETEVDAALTPRSWMTRALGMHPVRTR